MKPPNHSETAFSTAKPPDSAVRSNPMPTPQDARGSTTVGEQYDLPPASSITTLRFGDWPIHSPGDVRIELVPMSGGDAVVVPDDALSLNADGEIVLDHERVRREFDIAETVRVRAELSDPVRSVQRQYVSGDLSKQEFESRLETALQMEATDAE